jgi:hypothetical protein
VKKSFRGAGKADTFTQPLVKPQKRIPRKKQEVS